MPYKHIVSESKLDRIIEEADENDHDVDGVRRMYWTRDEAMDHVVKLHLHWGHTFCEITDIDFNEETVTLSELFTGREFTENLDTSLDVPFIGEEFTIEWIEGRIDGDWTRISEYSGPSTALGPGLTDEYRNDPPSETRYVSKTYEHKSSEYDSWAITVDNTGDDVEIIPDTEDLQNPDVFQDIKDTVELPDDMNLSRLEIGTVYTKTHLVEVEAPDADTDSETPDTTREKQYEIVWWRIKSQFENRGRTGKSISPVTRLDREPV